MFAYRRLSGAPENHLLGMCCVFRVVIKPQDSISIGVYEGL